jgi:putative chitinase
MPHAQHRADEAIDALNAAFEKYEINTQRRQAFCLAHLAHESGELKFTREIASGQAYEGRADLGNTHAGDGQKFKGFDWMQITGKKNTGLFSVAMYGDLRLVEHPELLNKTTPERCAESSAWFWTVGAGLNLGRAAHRHGLKDGCNLNDSADDDDFLGTTLAINGGTNGWAKRVAYRDIALKVLA